MKILLLGADAAVDAGICHEFGKMIGNNGLKGIVDGRNAKQPPGMYKTLCK